MTKEELSALGLTEQDVLDRLVDRLVSHYSESEDGYKDEFESRMEKAIRAHVDETLGAALEKHILPNVTDKVDTICLQETNKWGEKTGKPLTFTEYLTQRVDAYIREPVNYKGDVKGDSYGWSQHGTRISYMIHEHLQYNIQKAVEVALGNVNSSVRKGLQEAVNNALDSVKVIVDTKVSTR